MTGAEFKAALRALGMPRGVFAWRAGIDPSTVSRYITGALAVPQWAAWIIELLQGVGKEG